MTEAANEETKVEWPDPIGGKSWDSLRLDARTTTGACGIYTAGDPEKCYARLFVTDSGRVVPITGLVNEEMLMTVYEWGREDGSADQHLAKHE